jgi:hypothetical protein
MSSTRPIDIKRIERWELVKWIVRERANFALTLNPNQNLTPNAIARHLGKLLKTMDEKVVGHGGRIGTVATEDRLWAVAFIEHPDSNIHLHVALRLETHQLAAIRTGEDGWRQFIDEVWSAITKGSGSIMFNRITSPDGWGGYVTKEGNRHDLDYILAADFHPQSAVSQKGYRSIEISSD